MAIFVLDRKGPNRHLSGPQPDSPFTFALSFAYTIDRATGRFERPFVSTYQILIVFFSSVSVLNYYFSQVFFKRFDIKIEPLPEFKTWDLSWYWCWGVIAGIALVVIPSFSSSLDRRRLSQCL